jgi:hypothetical protein
MRSPESFRMLVVVSPGTKVAGGGAPLALATSTEAMVRPEEYWHRGRESQPPAEILVTVLRPVM